MESKPQKWRPNKRPNPNESEKNEGKNKRPAVRVDVADDQGAGKIFKFRVLLPNGASLGMKIRKPDEEMFVEEFVEKVKEEYFRAMRRTESWKLKRGINWKNKELYFVDAFDRVIKKRIDFRKFAPNKYHILRLHDGAGEVDTYENMWDLTPHTELLMELPEEYTFETALADLIDNSLQAVWSNEANERRLISVEILEDKISIFDSGPGMDGSDENSIVKWGKMGASLHRSSKGQAIGGKPPYLMPFFGMFGYGGPIASMHLGRHTMVSSKTKESRKVYTLRLEREALLNSSGSERNWKTDGGVRNPKEDEIGKSPHGTFTKVEIFEPKMKSLDISQLQCKLKDIYFPYIQCDEVSSTGKTITPIEFQVNDIDLAEIEGGEIATTNLHSCNGPDFVLQLHFHYNHNLVPSNSPGLRASQEANARLKCVYFPIVQGKESIERILEKLEAEEFGIKELFDSFSRVSIRRLGRLLPDARWSWLPFMEPRQRKGERAQVLKRCYRRVKCFIDTDAGFNPTPSKTDLAHHHPYTTALRNLGIKPLDKEKEVTFEIYRDGKQITLLQLERLYHDWICQMHDRYDEEIDSGEDQPILVVCSSNTKKLGVSSDVVRVHKVVRRKGSVWKSGQKIKILKGACTGCHKNNVYAILEYILLEGFQGDAGGEARLICRPLGIPEENGCQLAENDETASIDIRSSISLPINVIDSGKCLAVETAEWNYQLDKQRQKIPSSIDILTVNHCQELEVEGALPTDAVVYAGHVPPKEIVAVVRPLSFNSVSASEKLDQKYIVKENLEMTIEVKRRAESKNLRDVHIYSGRKTPTSRKGIAGLYIFPLGCKFPKIFEKAGLYTFTFTLKEPSLRICKREIQVKPLSEVAKWEILYEAQRTNYCIRVGSCFPPLAIVCYDAFSNRIPFPSVPKIVAKIVSFENVVANVREFKVDLSSNSLSLRIKDMLIESNELDKIRPSYKTTLLLSPQDESFSLAIPCEIIPGFLQDVKVHAPNSVNHLLPGNIIEEFSLEMFDAHGNHARGGTEVQFDADGLHFQDQKGYIRKVDDDGFLDLSGLLKVTGGYGRNVSFSVSSSERVIFKKEFQIERRELKAASTVPKFCTAGSQLENLVFEIVNSEGKVDETIHDEDKHGQSHTLTIKSNSMDVDDSVRYSFRHGRCNVRAIPLPEKDGIYSFVAAHSRHPELLLDFEVYVQQDKMALGCSVQSQHFDNKVLFADDYCVLKAAKPEHDDVPDQFSDGKNFHFQDPSTPKIIHNLVGSIMNEQRELENDVLSTGLSIGSQERTLKMLKDKQVTIQHEMSMLQDSVGAASFYCSDYSRKREVMMEQIENKGDSAAAVVCRLFRKCQQEELHHLNNVLGVVALLGTVQTNELSRILAEYLGEDQMLAVVCTSYEAAGALEKYEENGNVDCARALHAFATKLGCTISGRYLVICTEGIRPYVGELGSDPQRRLLLSNPTLPTGSSPPGFLGYAVNMIDLDVGHLYTRTLSGYGLRETLFYCLFSELQVYDTRENMRKANAYIEHGAVSLDGGIFRGNGVISLGYGEPHIQFPVIEQGSQMDLSPRTMEILEQIEEKKSELRKTRSEIAQGERTRSRLEKKFKKRKDRYTKRLDEMTPMLKSLEYSPNFNSSNDSPR